MSGVPADDLRDSLNALEARCRHADYKGWDPFDGLNSGLFTATPLRRWPLARLAWIQFFKRSPINLRPIVGVEPTDNAKGLALFSMGYGLLSQHEDQAALIERLLALRQTPASGPQNRGWGYPFDWQSRAFFVPRGTPNVVCTAYAVQALHMHAAQTGADHSQAIAEAGRFVHASLTRKGPAGETYIAYVPDEQTFVHNANLWGAYVLALAGSFTAAGAFSTCAREAIASTVAAQGADGSWPYGTRSHHGFVDSFHTGYNLQALHKLHELLPEIDVAPAIQRGMAFYTRTFFSPDGRPGYYATTPWPIDCHSAAQAVLTLLEVAPNAERTDLARRVLEWTVGNMWGRSAFAYQLSKWGRNRIIYMRWTQAWMFLALAAWQESARPGSRIRSLRLVRAA